MGSHVEINDVLSLNRETGFPEILDYEQHKQNPINIKDLEPKVFHFFNKSGIRFYKAPPLKNVLVQNLNGTWIHWGLIEILELTYDYQNKHTCGSFRIVKIFSIDEIESAKIFYENSSGN